MAEDITAFRNQLSIDTPELVSIEFPVAGIGSRCLAVCLDYFLQGIAFWVVFLLVVLFAPGLDRFASRSGKWLIALFILVPFLLQWGYFTLFEAFWNGQTPGKRITKLRVIQQTGRPIDLFESMTRNLIRCIDALPGFYLVGAVTMLATRRQQRVGDLVAGTLVVHERKVDASSGISSGNRIFIAAAMEPAPVSSPGRSSGMSADCIAKLSNLDLQILESFLERRLDLPLDTRSQLAQKLVNEMIRKMRGSPSPGVSNETFLEGVAHDLRALQR